jgi:hypothetical protein
MTPETLIWVRFGIWSFSVVLAALQLYTQIQSGNKSASIAWVITLLTLLSYGAPEK